ncbi:dTDP-4-dehydrorhamnose reductase [Haliea sp. E17]|uniref:dTDP-4-dehydrorhamnose reductase n=1 Tax=Haliea sp. E17 TaxID=3401576 RepID=UPI003AAB8DD2
MTATILITGAGGQLGQELARSIPAGMRGIALGRAELDIADAEQVHYTLAALAPAVVINAAAYTAVDRAESEVVAAMAVNAAGPAALAAGCAQVNARLIHISTDFVFDGAAATPYAPNARPAPLGVYGRSKLAGEQRLRGILPEALVLRTGWVYSARGANFVKTMLRLMAERDTLTVVADQVGTPTWAAGLAGAIWAAVDRPAVSGTYHWSDAGVCSWYDFAVAIAEEALALGLLQGMPAIRPIPGSAYPTPARRPAFSVLDKTSSWRDLELEPVHWRQNLRRMLAELAAEKSL